MIALRVSYDGAPFHGFVRQEGLETVEGRLGAALARVVGRPVEIVVAGRTDAGVHALGQVVSFAVKDGEVDVALLRRSLNGLVGRGIVVTEVLRAPAGFSARFDAISREYRYRIVSGPVPPCALGACSWHVKKSLDLGAMRAAAAHLLGEHDFRSFCLTASAQDKNTVRRLDLIEIGPEVQLGEHSVVVRVVGAAFLHSMVRTIVGTLVAVGVGRHDPEWAKEVLLARDRAVAGQTAPAKGLTFWHVGYPEEMRL